jgi:hypothetical protein
MLSDAQKDIADRARLRWIVLLMDSAQGIMKHLRLVGYGADRWLNDKIASKRFRVYHD